MLHVYYTALGGTDAGKAEDVLKIAQDVRLSCVYFNLLYSVHGCTEKLKILKFEAVRPKLAA